MLGNANISVGGRLIYALWQTLSALVSMALVMGAAYAILLYAFLWQMPVIAGTLTAALIFVGFVVALARLPETLARRRE